MAPLHKCNKHTRLSGQNSIASNKSLIMMAAAVHHDEAAESGLHAGGERSLRHHRLHRHHEGSGGSAAWSSHPDGEVRSGAKPIKIFFFFGTDADAKKDRLYVVDKFLGYFSIFAKGQVPML
jgi:hypothetical protein